MNLSEMKMEKDISLIKKIHNKQNNLKKGKNKMIRVATLFSGVGTPEQSLKHLKVEHETVFACEIDRFARTTYLANNQEPKTFYDDVKKLDATKYLNKIDILIWGFPCTSFSLAGKQLGFNDPNTGDLFAQGARIMSECKPKISIIENVEGLLSNDKGNTIRTVLRTLNAIGYRVYMDLLNTKDFGGKTPQNRSRVYIICERKN